MKEYRDTPRPTMTDEEMVKDYPRLSREYTLLHQDYREAIRKQLTLPDVRFELPDTKEVETRLKHVVDESFEDYEVVEKREYSLGFRACFNWLKIKQMQTKGKTLSI